MWLSNGVPQSLLDKLLKQLKALIKALKKLKSSASENEVLLLYLDWFQSTHASCV